MGMTQTEDQIDLKTLFPIAKAVMSGMLNLSVLDVRDSGIAAENVK